MEEQKDEIRNLISRIGGIPIETIGNDTHLSIDLGLDSLSALELMTALEGKFTIRIAEEQLTRFTSVNSLDELVSELKVNVMSAAR